MTEIDSGWAAINGARIFYRSAGSGPPLLLLHAGICDSRMPGRLEARGGVAIRRASLRRHRHRASR